MRCKYTTKIWNEQIYWAQILIFNQIIVLLRYILGARSRKYRTKGVLRGDSRCAQNLLFLIKMRTYIRGHGVPR